jgi:hypothetical protein
MKFGSLVALVTATLLLVTVPAFAAGPDAAPTPDAGPIRLDATQVVPILPGIDNGGYTMVTFTDTGKSAAKSITFGLVRNGYLSTTIVDKGTFSPNVTITHQFRTVIYDNGYHVAVVEAQFADGTSWENLNPNP